MSIGETVSGSTCGGTHRFPGESPCDNGDGGPVVFFYVDAPAGAAIRINSTPALSVFEFDDCASPWMECGYHTTSSAPNDPNLRLFCVELIDPNSPNSTTCGDFTITVVNQ